MTCVVICIRRGDGGESDAEKRATMRVYSAGGRFHGFFRLHSGFGHCIVGWEGSVGAETGKLREVRALGLLQVLSSMTGMPYGRADTAPTFRAEALMLPMRFRFL